MFFLLSAASCSPRIVETVRTEVEYRDRVRVDTTWMRDSVYIRETVKGDTIRITEFRDHIVYRYRMVRDTVSLVDSVAFETVKEVQVEKPLSGAQRAKIGLFWWLVLAVAGFAGWTFRKPLSAIITKIVKRIF